MQPEPLCYRHHTWGPGAFMHSTTALTPKQTADLEAVTCPECIDMLANGVEFTLRASRYTIWNPGLDSSDP